MESIKEMLFRQRIEKTFNEKLLEKEKRIEELEKIINQTKKPVNETKKNTISTKQKILILHYLGILDKIELTTKKKAIVLSLLLERTEQDIKTGITYVNSRKIGRNEIKTKSNIEFVKNIFQEYKIDNYNNEINKDLQKLESL